MQIEAEPLDLMPVCPAVCPQMSEVSLVQGLPVVAGISGWHEETEEAWNRLHVSGSRFTVLAFIIHVVSQKRCKKLQEASLWQNYNELPQTISISHLLII